MKVPDYVAPIIAYRLWQWDYAGLRSLNGVPWIPGQPLVAECRAFHPRRVVGRATHAAQDAPQADCRCGVYASKSLDLLRSIRFWDCGIRGEVWLWGTVVEHVHGWRAQFAYPKSLHLSPDMLPAALAKIQSRLQSLIPYRCDIFVVHDGGSVPLWRKDSDWAQGNRLGRGQRKMGGERIGVDFIHAFHLADRPSSASSPGAVVSAEGIVKALDNAAVSLRGKLGESLSTVQKYDTPVAEATTPSLEALKVYSLGLKAWSANGGIAALPFFKRAVELDPNFAMAYSAMSSVYGDLNELGRAAENARKAYELREKVSERERFFIEGNYYRSAKGELEKDAQTGELWQQTYPRDDLPYIVLGDISGRLGNWEKALEEWRAALRLEPNDVVNYINLGLAYTTLNRLEEAEAVYKQAEERRLEDEGLLLGRYWLAFLKDDTAQMQQLVSSAMGKPGSEDLLLAMQADTEGWYGKLKNAHELTRRAMDSAQRNDAKETAAGYQAEAALRDVESGNREQARAEAHAALKLAPEPRCAGHSGAGPGAGRRYRGGGEAGGRTRQDLPAGHAGPEVLAAHDPGGGRLGTQRPEPGN